MFLDYRVGHKARRLTMPSDRENCILSQLRYVSGYCLDKISLTRIKEIDRSRLQIHFKALLGIKMQIFAVFSVLTF